MKKILFSIAALAAVSTFTQAGETVTDICGNTYPVVTIGTQTWMAENLKCNKYDTESEAYNASWLTNNTIPTSKFNAYTTYYTNATNKTKWSSTEHSGSLSSKQIAKLGYLYNWAATVGIDNGKNQKSAFSGNRQGICPNGWHVPSNAEWQTLYDYIYSNHKIFSNVVGKYLKTTSGWYGNGNGIDNYSFAVLPSGTSYDGSSVVGVGSYSIFWTATPREDQSFYAYCMFLPYDEDYLFFSCLSKTNGQSVRCVKGIATPATEIEADASSGAYKVIENGKVVIIKGDKKYNLQGVEIK